MSDAEALNEALDQMDAADGGWERGLHGILDDLEKKCEGTLKPRGHWPIPGNSDDAYEYLNDYESSPAVFLELNDGSLLTSEVLNLLVGIRMIREQLEDGTAELDANHFGYWVFAIGLVTEDLMAAFQRKLAFSAIKMKRGANKGNRSPERLNPINQRNQAILETARKLMKHGKNRRDLAGLFVQRWGGRPGYPSTTRQYREILKGLDK